MLTSCHDDDRKRDTLLEVGQSGGKMITAEHTEEVMAVLGDGDYGHHREGR